MQSSSDHSTTEEPGGQHSPCFSRPLWLLIFPPAFPASHWDVWKQALSLEAFVTCNIASLQQLKRLETMFNHLLHDGSLTTEASAGHGKVYARLIEPTLYCNSVIPC